MTDRVVLPEVLASERLTLRPWRRTDVDDVLAYARDEEWARFLRVLPRPYERTDAVDFIERQLDCDRSTHPAWAVVLDDTVIGGINLRIRLEHRLGEVGYSIARTHWNHGYCTEAARAVIDAAFESWPGLNRVCAFADVENSASQRVMAKLGMTKEGVLRQNRIERGDLIDEAWWGLLRSEWTGSRRRDGR